MPDEEKIILDETSANPDMEADFIPYSPQEEIASAYYALAAMEDIDPGILSEMDRSRILQIKKWALRIIHYHMKDMYADLVEMDKQRKLSNKPGESTED